MMGRNIRPLKLMDDSPKPGEAVEVMSKARSPMPKSSRTRHTCAARTVR